MGAGEVYITIYKLKYYTISPSKLQGQFTKNNRHTKKHDGYFLRLFSTTLSLIYGLSYLAPKLYFPSYGPFYRASVLTNSSSTAPGATIGSTRSLCATTASIRKFFPCLRAFANAAVNSAQVVTVATSAPQALATPTKINGVRIVEEYRLS